MQLYGSSRVESFQSHLFIFSVYHLFIVSSVYSLYAICMSSVCMFRGWQWSSISDMMLWELCRTPIRKPQTNLHLSQSRPKKILISLLWWGFVQLSAGNTTRPRWSGWVGWTERSWVESCCRELCVLQLIPRPHRLLASFAALRPYSYSLSSPTSSYWHSPGTELSISLLSLVNDSLHWHRTLIAVVCQSFSTAAALTW